MTESECAGSGVLPLIFIHLPVRSIATRMTSGGYPSVFPEVTLILPSSNICIMYAQVDSSVPGDLPILCVGFNHLRRAGILFFF